MKILSSIWFGLLILFHVAGYIGYYLMGRLDHSWVYFSPFMVGAVIVIAFLGLVTNWVVSLMRRKDRTWTTALIVGFLVLIFVLPPEGATRIYGIHNRVMEACSLDDLRRFARDVVQNIPNANVSPWDASDLTGERALAYKKLRATYPFMKWGLGETKGPFIMQDDGDVDVFWGNGSTGHWGFSVSIGLSKGDSRLGTERDELRESDDVHFFEWE